MVRFGVFELDLTAGELRRNGRKIKLQEQPFEILSLLLEHPCEVVTQEQIIAKLWPDGTVVEYEHSIRTAVKKLRQALSDDADTPRYVETLPRRGYRFIALVNGATGTGPRVASQTEHAHRSRRRSKNIDSLAVLPFANATGEPDAEYLSEGITEAIINNLSQLSNLRVVPRNTAFRYKATETDLARIALQLGVRAVVTGRLMQHGENLIISAELVDVASESQLWGERYNRKFSDVFAVQEEIATQISERLRPKLTGEERRRLTRRHTQSRKAYEFYLKGRYHWSRRTPDNLKRALEYFEQAIHEDPVYALAHAGAAEADLLLGWFHVLTPKEALERAKGEALKAIEFDPQLAEGYTALGFARGCDRDWAGAEAALRHAVRLNPRYWLAHGWSGLCLSGMGRLDEAVTAVRRALDSDPLSLVLHHHAAWIYFLARRYDEAIEQCRKALQMEPNYPLCQAWLGLACTERSMHREALTALQQARENLQDVPFAIGGLGHAYARAGFREEARQ